jgi:TRAP-type C4-dicarboxylate transport system permease small subunit
VRGLAAACGLGDEARCAAPPLAMLGRADAAFALFELERWAGAAAAIRLAQLVGFALLLPALIWLLVEPRARAAQATCAVGATVAGFAALAIAFYRATIPAWAALAPTAAPELALVAAAAVVGGAVVILRHALDAPRAVPPRAVATLR